MTRTRERIHAITFVGLNPRKSKRRTVEKLLLPVGSLYWLSLPRLRFASYPETAERAEAAYAAAKRPARNALRARLQKLFYAWSYNSARAYFHRHPDHVAVAWNGLNGVRRAFMDAARDAGARRLFFELAPFKGCVTCDPVGVNQANALPRSAAFYMNWMKGSGLPAEAWRKYRTAITQRAPLSGKLSSPALDQSGGPYVFAPLQVPGDSQLRVFGGNYRTVPEFVEVLKVAANSLPDGWHVRIKEHPTAKVSFADQIASCSPRVVLDNQTDTFTLVAGSALVMTVNSSVGLEAMFFDKPVVACGQCFWAIPGIADTAQDLAAVAAVFARPEEVGFDQAARGAFLSYLLNEYYLATDASDPDRDRKILSRLGEVVVPGLS